MPKLFVELIGKVLDHLDNPADVLSLLSTCQFLLHLYSSRYFAMIDGFKFTDDVLSVTGVEGIHALCVWTTVHASPPQKVNVKFGDDLTASRKEMAGLVRLFTSFISSPKPFLHHLSLSLPQTIDTMSLICLLKTMSARTIHICSNRYSLIKPSDHQIYDPVCDIPPAGIEHFDISMLLLEDTGLHGCIRQLLHSNPIKTLSIVGCGSHCILAKLRLPQLKVLTVDMECGIERINSFLAFHPMVDTLYVVGSPSSFLPPIHHSTNLKALQWLMGPMFAIEHILANTPSPNLKWLSLFPDYVKAEIPSNPEALLHQLATFDERVAEILSRSIIRVLDLTLPPSWSRVQFAPTISQTFLGIKVLFLDGEGYTANDIAVRTPFLHVFLY